MLALDRYLDFHFFTNDLGGNLMNFINLFWLFGHPEVYLVVLPAFGVYSEVFSTFSAKRLYGYASLVYATMAIAVISFTVWLHHFFTMGQSANINAVFGIATMLIGIPTGVKIYNWLLTMFRGRVRFTVPLLYGLAFVLLFAIGGLTGMILANPTIDYQVHNTLFLVAHFHNVLIPGTLFGMLAGYHFWFPKAFGFRLDETWGRISCACWVLGFILAFFPLYGLGLLGMPRRSVAYLEPAYLPFTLVALVGAALVLCALASLVVQLWISIRRREAYRVYAGDPWDGRSLEWSISAPPPEYNFPVLPEVSERDAFTVAKEHGHAYDPPAEYVDIAVPRNSALGMIICVATALAAFGLVWYMWWLAILGFAVTWGAVIARSFVRETHKIIPAREVEETDRRWRRAITATRPASRDDELVPANHGLAEEAA